MTLHFGQSPEQRLFYTLPGEAFAPAFAQGLRQRLGAAADDPAVLYPLHVLLSTERLRRGVETALLDAWGRAVILPRFTALGQIGLEESDGVITPLRRLLALADQIGQAAGPSLPQRDHPAHARALAGLFDEFHRHRISPARIAEVVALDKARHWEVAEKLFDLVAHRWQDWLANQRLIEGEAARAKGLELLFAQGWPQGPTLVAGSTGSVPLSAEVMQAVLAAPQGAVVLPGYDPDLDDSAWAELTEDHAQFGFRQLLQRLGLPRTALQRWTAGPAPQAARRRLLSMALRPAPVTDHWRAALPAMAALAPEATADITLLPAPHMSAQARAIALALRQGLAVPGQRMALVTPDRNLARMVAAELRRWGLTIDDTGGTPLALTPPGVFLTLLPQVTQMLAQPQRVDAALLLGFLKNPFCRPLPRGAHLALTRQLQRVALSGHSPIGLDGLIARLRQWVDEASTPEGRDRRQAEAQRLRDWLEQLRSALAPLLLLFEGGQPVALELLVNSHLEAAQALGAFSGVAESLQEDAAALEMFLQTLAADAKLHGPVAPAEYPDIFVALLAGQAARRPFGQHPRLSILGAREARALDADLVILGGLNEDKWPELPAPDPWLPRVSRRALNLPLPERRIGLSMHDAMMAWHAPKVVLSWAERIDGATANPSRWVVRLQTLLRGADPASLAAMTARGEALLAEAAALAADPPAGARLTPAPRPAPTPPRAVRPDKLSVTEIETLIRDPYAIYARHVLRLRPSEALGPKPAPLWRGILLHQVMERAARNRTKPLMAHFREVMSQLTAHPLWRAQWDMRFQKVAPELSKRLEEAQPHFVGAEIKGESVLTIPLADGESWSFRLSARADRIDRLPRGYLLVDYKSGKISTPQMIDHFDRQLPLMAAMLVRGGFDLDGPHQLAGAEHWSLTNENEFKPVELTGLNDPDAVWEDLQKLLARWADPAQPYQSHSAMFNRAAGGAYDRLARVAEWKVQAEEEE